MVLMEGMEAHLASFLPVGMRWLGPLLGMGCPSSTMEAVSVICASSGLPALNTFTSVFADGLSAGSLAMQQAIRRWMKPGHW